MGVEPGGAIKKLSKIFLSYSRKDSKRAEALERALTERGMNVWRHAEHHGRKRVASRNRRRDSRGPGRRGAAH